MKKFTNPDNHKNRKTVPSLPGSGLYYLAVAVFLLGLVLRAVEVINGNYIFGHDHGRDYLLVKNMIDNLKPTLIGSEVGSGSAGFSGIFQGPGYYYILAIAYILFSGNPYGAVVVMFVLGLVTMGLTYRITRKISGAGPALIALFFTAGSYLIVSQSRFFWSDHPIPIFILLAFWATYMIPVKPDTFAPLAVFLAGLTYHFQLGTAVPMVLGQFISLRLIYKVKSVKIYLVSALAAAFAFSPMMLFELRHDFLGTRNFIAYLTRAQAPVSPARTTIADHLWGYWYNFANTFTFEFSPVPGVIQTIILVAVTLMVLGEIYKVSGKARQLFVYFTVMILVTWSGFLILDNVVWDYYLIHLRHAYIIIFAYGINKLFTSGRKSFHSKIGLFVSTVFFVIFGIGMLQRVYVSYRNDLTEPPKFQKISGKKLVLDYLYKDAGKSDFNLLISVPYLRPYPYTYLMETYAKSKYGRIPGDSKIGLTYFIVEPDPDQPWMREDWMKKAAAGSRLIGRHEIAGLLIEKRMYPK